MAVVAMEATRGGSQAVYGVDAQTEGIAKGLTSSYKVVVLNALSQLERVRDNQMDIKIWDSVARLTSHQDAEVAASAIAVLSSLDESVGQYMEYILASLRHPAVVCRVAAVEALGRLGRPSRQEVKRLVAGCLKDQESRVRAAAVRALGQMKAAEQAEAISSMLQDDSADVRCSAIEALGLLVSGSAEAEALFSSEALNQSLPEMLAVGATRCSALVCIATLGRKAPGSCVNMVITALADEDPMTRQAAVSAFGRVAQGIALDSTSMQTLKGLLKSADAGIRAAAAYAVGTLGQSSVCCVDILLECLVDGAADDSGPAAPISNTRRLPVHLRIPKCAAAGALARIGGASYAANIANLLFDQNWEVRVNAAEVLATLGDLAKNEVSSLLSALDDDAFPVRAMACRALGAIKDIEALPRLVEAFEDRAHSVRIAALRAVAEMGECAEDISHDVLKLLDDSLPGVRAEAVRCLCLMGESARHYATAVGPLLEDDDPDVRCAAVKALSRMGTHGAAFADEVEECLDDPSAEVRQAAVEALRMMGKRSPELSMLQDFSRCLGIPVETGSSDGLAPHYGGVQQKKAELQVSGKWIEGVL